MYQTFIDSISQSNCINDKHFEGSCELLRIKGNAHVNFSKPIAENVLGHNSAICEATDPIFWEVCPLVGLEKLT